MPGRSWTTEEQATFLTGYVEQYMDAQANKEISSAFWPRIFREWFAKYPEKNDVFPEYGPPTEGQNKEWQSALDARRRVSLNNACPVIYFN